MEDTVARCTKFYLTDGDVVLRSAPDSDGKASVYRVNKSVLSLNSPVFSGMFSLPDAEGVHEMYDGAPVVFVTDTEEELSALLQALYDPAAMFSCRFDPDKPIRLTPVMKLAAKYEMDAVRERVINAIRSDWPETFEQWARIDAELFAMARVHEISKSHLVDGKSLYDRIPEPAAVVRFAREFDIPSILPSAYYALVQMSPVFHWDQRNRYSRGKEYDYWRPAYGARWELLSSTDYKIVLCLKQLLVSKLSNITSDFSGQHRPLFTLGRNIPEAAVCSSRDRCRDGLAALFQQWKENEFGLENMLAAAECPAPLKLLNKLRETRSTWNLCESCKRRICNDLTLCQEDLWEQITMEVEGFEKNVT